MQGKRRTVRSTNAQIKMLVDYMANNPAFLERTGEFYGPRGYIRVEEEWTKLAASLTPLGPPKTVEQWKTTWRDLKKNAIAHIESGEGPLRPICRKVLEAIGHESVTNYVIEDESGTGNGDSSIDSHSFDFVLVDEEPQPVQLPTSLPSKPMADEESQDVQIASSSTPEPPEVRAKPTTSQRKGKKRKSIAAKLLLAQRNTNTLLKEMRQELTLSNQLRMEQIDALKKIAKNLEQM